MNKDRVKGTIDDVAGSAKRKAGEWTGDTPLQIEGIAQQVKGKIESTLGKAKDAVRETSQDAKVRHNTRVQVELSVAKVEPAKHL